MSPYRKNAVFHAGWLLDLPIKKKLYLIIGLLIGNVVVVILLGTFALTTISSIRAAVAGESIWAKAQKTAVFSLRWYALSQDERAYQDYLEALKIPIAYGRANREFIKAKPDFSILDQAFIEAGVHPKDVPGFRRLFINFQKAPHVASAFRAWSEGQMLISELTDIATQLRGSYLSPNGKGVVPVQYVNRINSLDRKITALEMYFSSELGEASRWATNIFLFLMIGGSLLIGALSVAIALYISREIVTGVDKISQAAFQVAKGDLKVRVAIHSKDELGKLADVFNYMTEGLGKLDVLKTEFFSNISHEFRTPLTLILGPLEELLSSPIEKDLSPTRKSLEIVYRNALRLLKLVNSLLDFSRLEAGKLKALYVPTDLSTFTIELASHFASAVEKEGLEYGVECQPATEPLYVDRDMWEKIVFNLLSNALKFTFEGKISLQLSYEISGIRLEVRDTGTGISAAEIPNLFERFHRIQGARSRTHEGSGIGLSLVRDLVRLHGGSVEVESLVDEGTTFTVHIPFGYAHLPPDQISQVSTNAPSAIVRTRDAYVQEASLWLPDKTALYPATIAPESLNKEKPRILIVDDNADMCTYITRLLAPEWDVEVACSGTEALNLIQRSLPDVVLSDIMMPQMNGFELLKRLRQAPATQHLPIIFLSAHAGEESRLEGIIAGADDYLVKPFSAKELIARVNTHLKMSRVREQIAKDATVISLLKTEQKWLESALNLMPIPLLLVSSTTARVTFANRAADVMAGGVFPKNISIEDYSKTYKLTDQEDRELPLSEWPLARAARGEKIEGETVVCYSEAGRTTVLISADTLPEMHRHPKTILMTFQNVTTLSNAIQSRDDFLSIASHELRTPLTSLRLQLQLTQRELKPEKGIVPTPERLVKLIHIFDLQTNRLTNLVEDLLDISRIQLGKLCINPESCNLSELLQQALDRLSSDLANAQCPLELNIEKGVTGLWEKKRIEQVITNVMINAIKYASGKPIRVSLATRDKHAYLTIQDFGPGIEKEKQAQLFERFERGVSSRNISGLGLGLFISKEIIKAHRGEIDLTSAPGKGSIFTVNLPLHHAIDLNGVAISLGPQTL